MCVLYALNRSCDDVWLSCMDNIASMSLSFGMFVWSCQLWVSPTFFRFLYQFCCLHASVCTVRSTLWLYSSPVIGP